MTLIDEVEQLRRTWWTDFGLTFALIGQVYTVVGILSIHQRGYDQMVEAAQTNAAERERFAAALEIAVTALRTARGKRKAIGQAKKAWKDIYGDSL